MFRVKKDWQKLKILADVKLCKFFQGGWVQPCDYVILRVGMALWLRLITIGGVPNGKLRYNNQTKKESSNSNV